MTFPAGLHKESLMGTYRTAIKSVALDGGAGSGQQGTISLFTVTGYVHVLVVGWCTEDVVGAGTFEVGITGATAALIAQIADATNIDAGMIIFDATPADIEALSSIGGAFIGGGEDIFATVGTADLTDGTIHFVCFWTPLSADGNVVAA